ncbi:MAG: 2-amino-4-hydroxy-6-hydroxymethyldihydropteridine diphosphokinase [Planctomycetaceae bacterium]|nr:2-amino-4-hydroxy-6-hydroxymethyldihydropteridine diphosphokinase [Planctomycetaceae bacterium]
MCLGYISLGGNLGDVPATFDFAMRQLDAMSQIEVRGISSNFRTPAMGENAGADFWNAAAVVSTSLGPEELLDVLQSVEDACGRTRELHWGPRTLDLDLIQLGQEIVDTPRLKLPHPHCWYRRFVLDPLVEIAPDLKHPTKCLSYAELRDRLLPRPLHVVLLGENTLVEAIHKQLADYPGLIFDQSLSDAGLIIGLDTEFEAPISSDSRFLQLPVDKSDAVQSVNDALLAAAPHNLPASNDLRPT